MSNQVARNSRSNYVSKNIARYTLSADDPAANGVDHIVLWNTVPTPDTLSEEISLNTSTGVFTVLKDGLYIIYPEIRFDASAVGDRQIYVNFSGNKRAGVKVPASGAGNTILCSTHLQYLSAGTLFSIQVNQNSGGILDVTTLESGVTIIYVR